MRRFANLNNVPKVAIAATAVTVVAAVGVTLFSPSSSASATAQQSGSRQTVTENGVRFSFRVPPNAGWERHRSIGTKKSPGGLISLNRSVVGPQGAEAIIYWTSFPDGDYADPCASLLNRSVGRSAVALAAAVATAPGTKLVRGPSNATLGGRPAKHLVLAVRENVGCDPGFFYTWRRGYGGAFWGMNAGDTIRVWIAAVNGKRLFIASAATKQGDRWLKTEIQQIVESIRFA